MPETSIRPGPLARLAVAAIRLYQRRISARYADATGAHCRFTPTCSRYGELAYLRFGFAWGSVLTAWRLFRCSPWGGHGYDPVPDRRDGQTDPEGAPVQVPPAEGSCASCSREHRHGHRTRRRR
jgi:putative membrane protein insertion efficiency factor